MPAAPPGVRQAVDAAGKPGPGPRQFGTIEYWNREFDDRGEYAEPLDWLASWDAVGQEVMEIIPDVGASILVPGCGNAPFQLDMYDAGYTSMTCGDLSPVVISKMREAPGSAKRPDIQWDLLDATDMPYDDDAFDAIVDKSLLDCLRCCRHGSDIVQSYLDEALRVLKPGGILLLVSCHTEAALRADLRGRDWQVARIESYGYATADRSPCSADGASATLCAVKKVASRSAEEEAADSPRGRPGVAATAQQSRKAQKKAEKNRRRALRASMEEAGME